MTPPIPINIAVEDQLSEVVIRQVLKQSNRGYLVGSVYSRGGNAYLKKIILGLNSAAQGIPVLLLTDLDNSECPLALIGEWLPQQAHRNLIFRIAVREVESWIMADKVAFARFLGIKQKLIPDSPDEIVNAKEVLVQLAGQCKRREIRDDLVPYKNSTSRVGRNYNGRLSKFVISEWSVLTAAAQSVSLARAWKAIREFTPEW